MSVRIPGDDGAEVMAALKRIEAKLDAVMKRQAAPNAKAQATTPTGEAATDAELDGSRGDPEIKKDPPRWTGAKFAPCHMSQTSPEYLEVLASFKDWQAGKDDESGAVDAKDRPASFWKRNDAKLCRGWARRLRAGWKPQAQSEQQSSGSNYSFEDSLDPDKDIAF
jgi:hypothetical protein